MSSALLTTVMDYVDAHGGGEGRFELPTNGVRIVRSFQKVPPLSRVYHPSLCVVLQGAKQISFGDRTLDYTAMECLVVSLQLPASGRIIKASADNPFVGIILNFDVAMMRDILQQLDTPPVSSSGSEPCAFVVKVDAPLSDCLVRLVRLAQTPKAIPVLYPSIMREICYWLLAGPHGGELCKLALPATHSERIARAIKILRRDFAKTLRVEQLAEKAGMSASSFHLHFKSLTSMTPLQYQKQLRLIEARRLMTADGLNVSEAAFKVGYESASQFSREYSRLFGVAPKRDVLELTMGAV